MVKKELKAVILAGGEGRELFPLTQTKPKPMIKLLGKPILQYIIEELKTLGVTKILIVTGYKGEQIKDYFKKGSEFGLSISYAKQSKENDIKSAFLAAKKYLANDNEFLLLFSDIIAEKGLIQRTLNAYENTQADMAMALTLKGDTGNFGVVEIDYKGYVKSVGLATETDTKSNYIDAGCFVLKTTIFDELETQPNIPKSINARIKKGDKVIAAIWEKEWIDIGKPWNIIEANRLLLSKLTESRIASNVTIESNVVLKNVVIIDENTIISSGTVLIGPLYIGPNTYIGNNVLLRDHTSIDSNSLIGFGSEIKNSVLFSGTKIYRLCYVGDSVVGENTILSTNVMTINTETPIKSIKMEVNGHMVDTGFTKLGAIIGDNSIVGVSSMIFPGRKIAAGSIIPPGTHVQENVI
ncbi:MAG: NTP transferase domain-containing protein [Candidatus Heimdallarchaeum endolithica]|uniref:NTP transferase domain-containing protein n=1 Tax=Candidatus Heimdallarchaeum endolithica TaxID=2876572 RepID=A0A9Y1BP56_9ARCH|nr:MAG: NTP transferase domain-containing protein [Candidatus Heimdallarchaeum endolithica]